MKQVYHDSIDKVKATLAQGGADRRRHICEVQRLLYDYIDENVSDADKKNDGFDLVAESFMLGKRMANKLHEYNHKWLADDWNRNPDVIHKLDKRAKKLNLLYRIQSVQIQTIDYCNRKCAWCPNSYMDKSQDSLMDNKTLNRILHELYNTGFKGEVHPYLMGEPLTDYRMEDILRTCKRYLPKSPVKIITNGDGLKYKHHVQELIDAGADRIHVNHYDDKELMAVRDKDFPDNVSHYGFKYSAPTFNNRAGKVKFVPKVKAKRCGQFLFKLAFNYKGDLVLCCADYNYEVVFGNINDTPLSMIMASDLYQKYQTAHETGVGLDELPVCKECNYCEKTTVGNE